MDNYVLLDMEARKCGEINAAEAKRLLAHGYAVHFRSTRGVRKRVLQLTHSLAALSGCEPPRLLPRGWMLRNRFVERELVRTDGRAFNNWTPIAPAPLPE